MTNKINTLSKLTIFAALTSVFLLNGMGEAFAVTVGNTINNLGNGVSTLPRLVSALSMPVGIFLLIMGGINLVKLGKDPNAEGVRNVIFTLLAGVFVLSLNIILAYFRTAGTLNANTAINAANVGPAW